MESLPLDDRSQIRANLATINGNLNNGENENQDDQSMANASEIATYAKQDKCCQDLPERGFKETDSLDGMDNLTHGFESMNLKEQVHAASTAIRKEEFKTKVVTGKLNEIEADVLVNTTSLDLDLSKGAVSNAILKTAGAQLQTEINRNYPNGIKPFEIAVTNGYGLACKIVYHGALKFYDKNKRDKLKREFQMFMQSCLLRANKGNYQSIAFPAIGTGNLCYPLDFVVHEMFENVKQFKQTNPNTTLVEVLIVVFPGDLACEAFAKVQRLEDLGSAKHKNFTKQKKSCHFKIGFTGHKENTRKVLRIVCKQLKLE